MLKSILSLEGAQLLKKSEQIEISGGMIPTQTICCDPALHCCRTGRTDGCRFRYSTFNYGCI